MKVRALLVGALLWCVSFSVAFAQCGGQAASGYACGNGAASRGFASFYPLSTLFDRGIGSGQGTILNRTNTGWAATIAPTLGIPGTSQGTLSFAGATSGTATITAQATAGSPTITLPNTSGTLADGASSPLVLSATTGNLTCPTCVTSSGGGGITGTTPINVSGAGVVSLQGATGTIAVGSGGTGSSFTATPTLGVAGSTVGTIAFANLTSGSVTIQPATGALGAAVATLPAGTYNLVGDSLSQALTDKTYNGLTVTVTTGTLTIANGKTLTASNSLTFAGTDGTMMTFPGASDTVATLAAAQTLTNKTINGSSNTLTVLAGSQLSGQTPVANGGTNCAAASGTCLDNITGFSSTGFMSRTGPGTYSFNGAVPLSQGGLGGSQSAATANQIPVYPGSGGAAVPTSGSTWLNALGTLTWTQDQYFKSGRPWVDVRAYGAVGDGVTDDTAAIQNAINAAEAIPYGGAVYVPAGNYCIKTGPVILHNAGDVLMAASRGVALSACGVDNTLVELTSGNQSLLNFTLFGKGYFGDASSFGATKPVVLIQGTGGGCAQCLLDNLDIQGGSSGISISPSTNNGEFYIYRSYVTYAYGSAIIYAKNATGWLSRVKIDQNWPVSVPAMGATLNAWAANTPYTVGTVVTLGGYMIQCKTAGTSGASAPSLKNYGNNITDGTAVWVLAGNATGAALQIDTGSNEIYGTDVDMTGATDYGVYMSNSLSGTAPAYFRCVNCVAGQTASNTYYFANGHDVYLINNEVGGGFNGGTAVIFNTSFTGNSTIQGGYYGGGSVYGIVYASGSKYVLTGTLVQATSIGVAVQTGNVNVSNNNISGGATTGISINNSLAYIYVSGNICGGNATTCVNSPTGLTNNFIGNNF